VTTWDELPTLARRSFEEYLQRFMAANPGSAPGRTRDPVSAEGGAAWLVHFTDEASGTHYSTMVYRDGSVAEAVQVT
jgi:hypothetical protein